MNYVKAKRDELDGQLRTVNEGLLNSLKLAEYAKLVDLSRFIVNKFDDFHKVFIKELVYLFDFEDIMGGDIEKLFDADKIVTKMF